MPDRHANQDFVLLYAPPWSGPTRFSKHHLAHHLAHSGGRVLYVESPLSPLGLRRGRVFWRELAISMRAPHRVENRVWVRRHFLPVPYHAASWLTSRRAANRLGQRLLAPVLARDLASLGFDRPVLLAGLPHAVDALPWMPRRMLVYHCADDYAHIQGFPSTLPELEADLCQQADLVITTSETLCQERRQFNPNTHWVPNAADIEHFSSDSAPAPELQELPKPIIGFVGGLSQWVDLNLVGMLARARSDWSFVLVGPIGIATSAVDGLRNVRLLGPRAYAALPAYLAGMDVGLIPFTRDRVTLHADPIKAYEYLAAGLPVVATDMPALRRLAHVVRLASSPESFLNQLDAAIAEGRAARSAERRAEAAEHTWARRFESIDQLLHQSLKSTCAF